MDQSKPPRLTYRVDLPGGQHRLAEATLYVATKCQDAASFGLTKLNKVLWRADFRAYADRRQPVTGRQYQRLKQGPAPVEMPIVLDTLLADRALEIESRQVISFAEKRPVALLQPSLRWFSPDDLRYLDDAIKFYWEHTGRGVSKHSHGVAWETRTDGEPMPYDLALLSDDDLTPVEVAFFSRLGQERGWHSA